MSTDISSTPGAFRLRWDVFLSFRGPDTRKSFVNPLYDSLQSNGIRAFRDDDGLERGEEIAPALLEAIDDSAASIVVLSPKYAESRWCLEELAKICDCGRLVLPVFYGVDPSHVRKQTGPFQDAFDAQEGKYGKDTVLKWRKAMKTVGDLAGFVLPERHSDEDKATLIQRLVLTVLKQLSNTPLGVAQFTVGLEHRVEQLIKLLDLKSNGLRVLGLYGMGGVGKTTLAKALFNNLVAHFENRCFISNVEESSSKNEGLASLQQRIMNLTSNTSNGEAEGAAIKRNRVLIVLDDVDDAKQLDPVFDNRERFDEGSRIVITTRNIKILNDSNIDLVYEVKELEPSQALQLFSYHAMRRKEPTDNLLELSKQIVDLTGKLPLALEVFGSYLFDKRRIKEWEDALCKLKRSPPKHVQDVIKISYDGLDQEEKTIFLDIACLLVQMEMKREDVIDVLRGCGFSAEVAITVLTERCLVKIAEDDTLNMHDQVKGMGRRIVVDKSPDDPGMRSRLWDRNIIISVLDGNKGTRSIQGVTLDFQRKRFINDADAEAISKQKLQWWPILTNTITNAVAFLNPNQKKIQHLAEKEEEVTLQTKSFESMMNLRLLQINNLRLEGKFASLPAEIKWLQWQGCPYKNMPSDFWSKNFTVLDLSYSNIESLWGWGSRKVPKNLKVLNLSYCNHLSCIPDLSGCVRLDKVVLKRCTLLTRTHESIGSLSALHDLNLSECINLKELPNDVSGLKNLENLVLSRCLNLKALPANIGHMKSLRKLLADHTAIVELPETIFSLQKLEELVLDDCQKLKRLPNCIGNLTSLQVLSLSWSAIEELPYSIGSLASLEKLGLIGCQSLTAIPESVGNLTSLTTLSVNGSSIRELPSSVGSLSFLKQLSAGECKFLGKLPDSINGLASVVELELDKTAIENLPNQIGDMKILSKLAMRNCSNLQSLPESIGSLVALTTLDIRGASIKELPESIGSLENLVTLTLNKCSMLRKLPTSIGKLKNLHRLMMEETTLTDLPETFGLLSSLRTLKMAKRPNSMPNSNSLPAEQAEITHSFAFPTSFYNLSLLYVLDARFWSISGKIPNDFEKLSSLETLNLSQNSFHSLPSSLKGLSVLKKLWLRDCSELTVLPPLPSSLTELNAQNCTALQRVCDFSNLECLQELDLTNCEKLVDIPGLECLKSLRWLHLSGCIACSSRVRKRFSKVALRNLWTLSMPGNRFPEWFSGKTVNFSRHKNRELKGVVVCVVLSINHDMYMADEISYEYLPGVIDIQANVHKEGKDTFVTTLYARGVPKTNQEHLLLCRFPHFHPLVCFLKDGGTICVTKRNPHVDKRLELRNSGVHLILEGDDDYDGNENSIDQSLQSVSERMAEFFNSLQDDDPSESQD